MKKFMIFLICLIPFVLIFTIQMTSNFVEKTKYVTVEKIELVETVDKIYKESMDDVEYQLSVKIFPLTATNKNLIYFSSDETVAVVDETGKVTFKDFGDVTISVYSEVSNLITTSCSFHVLDTKPHRIELLNYPTAMRVGETCYVESKVIPNEAENKSITYSSTDTQVATISPDGKITAVGAGQTEIVLQTVNGVEKKFSITVTMPTSGIYIPAESQYRTTGKSVVDLPEVIVVPENATNKSVVFSSQNPNIAEIVDNKIVFFERGEATIVATTVDGGYSAEFVVNYTGGYVLSAEITNKTINVDYVEDKRISLEYDIFPVDADLNNVWFVSSKESVVAVDGDELVIKGGGNATVTMFANTGDSQITSVANVYIKRNATEIIAEDFSTENPICKLNYTVLTLDHTDEVTLSVNSNLATVSSDGMIKFDAQGTVKITISTSSGLRKEISVTYIKAGATIKEISSEGQEISLNYLDSFGVVFDDDLNFGVASFSGYDSSILQYDDDLSEFTAIKGGTTEVCATDGLQEITFSVTVIRKAENLQISSPDIDLSKTGSIRTSKSQIQINAQIMPEDTTTKNVTYSVDNSDVAEISQLGLLSFKKAGEVVVTISVDGISRSVTIYSSFNMLEDFGLNKTSIVFEDVGESATVQVSSVNPTDFEFVGVDITYLSLNTTVATVNSYGEITAVGKGNTKIQVKIGQVIKLVDVEVKVKTKSVSILHNGTAFSSGTILGKTIQLTSIISPTNANNPNVVWDVDSSDLATVSNGLLTFKDDCYGRVKVTVQTVDSGVFAEAYVTRIQQPETLTIYKNDVDVSNGSLTIDPDDTSDIVLKINIGATNLFDPEVGLANIQNSDESENGLQITITDLGDGYYSIRKATTINKALSTQITFSYNVLSVSLDVKYLNLKNVVLDLKNEDDVNFGIEQTRVFGTRSFATNDVNDYTTTCIFDIGYTREPFDNKDKLYWFSSNPSVAFVNEEEKLNLIWYNIPDGYIITITVGNAPNLDDCTIKRFYSYTFVRGFNVYNSADYIRCVQTGNSAILQTSLETEEDHGSEYEILDGLTTHGYSADLYGNGYTLNFNCYPDVIMFRGNVRNAILKAHNTSEDMSKDNYTSAIGFAAMPLVDSDGNTREAVTNTIEYCEIKNVKRVWTETYHADDKITFKNCIIKTCSQHGMQIGSNNVGGIYLENMIFADIAQLAVDFQAGSLYVKGFFDVYNFTKASDFSVGYETAIKNAYKDEALQKYIDSSGSDKKANLGIGIIPNLTGLSDRNVDTVYFWDKSKNDYVANYDSQNVTDGVVDGTGLGYERIHYIFKPLVKKYNVYLFCVPLVDNPNNYINSPDIALTEEGERKVYRLYGTV